MDTNKRIKKVFVALFISILLVYTAGCAEINLFSTPTLVLKHPLGTDPLRTGMTKNEVIDVWGKPDQINRLESTDEWTTPREEWVYVGRYSKVPIDRSYLSKTKYLIFDGNNLVSFGDESEIKLPKSEKLEIGEE